MCALMSFFIISPPCSIYHRKPIVSTILSTFPRQNSIKCLDSLEIVDYNVPSLGNVDSRKINLSFEEKGGNGMSTIVEVISKRVEDRGTTITHLSNKTGISNDLLGRSLNGKRKLKADELVKLCIALDLSLDDFKEAAREGA